MTEHSKKYYNVIFIHFVTLMRKSNTITFMIVFVSEQATLLDAKSQHQFIQKSFQHHCSIIRQLSPTTKDCRFFPQYADFHVQAFLELS